jgi:hypothetical protein
VPFFDSELRSVRLAFFPATVSRSLCHALSRTRAPSHARARPLSRALSLALPLSRSRSFSLALALTRSHSLSLSRSLARSLSLARSRFLTLMLTLSHARALHQKATFVKLSHTLSHTCRCALFRALTHARSRALTHTRSVLELRTHTHRSTVCGCCRRCSLQIRRL